MKYWKRVDKDGKTTTVESYSHDLDIKGAIEITEIEFKSHIGALPIITLPPARNLLAEIDALKTRIVILETK